MRLLRAMAVSRVHIHHLAGVETDIRALIRRLDLPFDVTVHDYYAICPRINFLPWPDAPYCGEPDHAGCNACIATDPPPGAHDILTWRTDRDWQFQEADRVLCPNNDVLLRLRRYGLDARAVVAPHEPIAEGPWRQHVTAPRAGKLRIAVLGVLADHKGARIAAAVAEAMDPKTTEIHLIGRPEYNFPKSALKRLKITGQYDDTDLRKMIARIAPHIIWFPTVSPETYSYTLTTAIESGVPIVANRIGAIAERLTGRPFTWLATGYVSPDDWLGFFETFRATLNAADGLPPPPAPIRPAVADFYESAYLDPIEAAATPPPPHMAPAHMPPAHMPPARMPPARIRTRARDNPPRRTIAVVPERYAMGLPTPCAYIRLLHPLNHPAIAGHARIVMADARSVLHDDVDVIVTQRHALPTMEAADALIAHARRTGAELVYDLDDDLLTVPPNHPDAATLRPRTGIVRHMLLQSDTVWLSSRHLAQALSPIRPDTTVIGNALDERIWISPSADLLFRDEPVRILCMGTQTHNRDFALIEPVLARLKEDYGDRIEIEIVGMTTRDGLAPGLGRTGPPPGTAQTYPGFVNWLTSRRPRWHIGVAPLLDTPFNRAKSAIKTMDYAALGLAILASDVPSYQGSLADGPAGQLVRNDPTSWYAALNAMIRDQDRRRAFAAAARPAFLQQASLASMAPTWQTAWQAAWQAVHDRPRTRQDPLPDLCPDPHEAADQAVAD
jgi:glycosyltransferase involved in cell wall biosynthesis